MHIASLKPLCQKQEAGGLGKQFCSRVQASKVWLGGRPRRVTGCGFVGSRSLTACIGYHCLFQSNTSGVTFGIVSGGVVCVACSCIDRGQLYSGNYRASLQVSLFRCHAGCSHASFECKKRLVSMCPYWCNLAYCARLNQRAGAHALWRCEHEEYLVYCVCG